MQLVAAKKQLSLVLRESRSGRILAKPTMCDDVVIVAVDAASLFSRLTIPPFIPSHKVIFLSLQYTSLLSLISFIIYFHLIFHNYAIRIRIPTACVFLLFSEKMAAPLFGFVISISSLFSTASMRFMHYQIVETYNRIANQQATRQPRDSVLTLSSNKQRLQFLSVLLAPNTSLLLHAYLSLRHSYSYNITLFG